MEKQLRLEKIKAESDARIEALIIENKKNSALRFVKILDQMISIAEKKGNVIVMSRREFNKIDRFSK